MDEVPQGVAPGVARSQDLLGRYDGGVGNGGALALRPLLKLVQKNCPEQTFAAVWQPYPRKESRKDALKAWCELDPDAVLIDMILSALEWQVVVWASRADWYTPPLFGSYIRSERWTDEPPTRTTRNPTIDQLPAWQQKAILGGRKRDDT